MAGYIGNKAVGINVTTGDILGDVGVGGNIDVDGISNLDVVDIDGAVNMATTALVTGVLTTTASAVFNGGFTSNGDTNTFTSANSTDPVLILKNTTNDTNGTRLHFIKDKGAAGADNDSIGTIQFTADNDAQQQILFGQILTRISDASDGAEGGQMQFSLASHDGEVQPFLNAVDGNAEDEIDVTIGSGTSSVTTIAGQVNAVGNVSIGVPTADTSLNFFSVTGGLAGSQLNAQMRFFGKSVSNTGVTYETARISGGSTSGSVALSGGLVFSTSSNNGSNVLTLAEKMRITDAGNLLVGKTATGIGTAGIQAESTGQLNVTQSGNTVIRANRLANDGTVIGILQANTEEGTISVSGGTVSYNAFSGSHWSRLTDNSEPTILKGTLIETIDEMCDWYQAQFTVLATTKVNEEGDTVEDVAAYTLKESIALPDGASVGDTISHISNDVTYSATIVKENDNKHPKCKISNTADSVRIYGVFAAWDNDEDTVNDMYVTAVGTHVVRVHGGQTVSAGDLLVSNGDGTAKVQDDDIIRSKTLGKVLTNIKQETYADNSYTVPCALYCG